MKKIALALFALLLMLGCIQTKVDPRVKKGAEIAKLEMAKMLYNIGSYDPVETRVDSAHTSVYTDAAVVKAAYALIKLNADEKRKELQREYNHAKSSAAMWKGLGSAYPEEQYRQAKEEMASYAAQIKELDDEVGAHVNIIRERAEAIVEGQFCGWNIYHRLRCKNGLGIQQIVDVCIIVDEKMETVKGRFSLDDYDEYSFTKLKKIIGKSIDKK